MKKYTIEKVRNLFLKEGYTLLSDYYKNNKQKLDYICPNNHRSSVSLNMWLRGNRCKFCSNNKPIIFDDIKKEFEEEGYTLLSDSIDNSKSRLKFICPNGHESEIIYNNWQQGARCYYCKNNISTFADVKKSFKEEGYIVLDKYENYDIINQRKKINYECPNGHISKIEYRSWLQGSRCKKCQDNKSKLTYNFIKKSFEDEGYTMLSENYVDSRKHLKYKCPYNHINSMTWFNWNAGWRCPSCNNKISSYENDLSKYLNRFKIIKNSRNIIPPYELDLFFPELNIAIEICGIYWHSTKFLDKNYHLRKLELCNKKNIRLITIFEDELLNKSDIVESILNNIFHINIIKINARDLEIKSVSNNELKSFLIDNHIQGYNTSSISLGLYDNYKLLSLMSLSKPSVAKGSSKNFSYELNRFCNKKNFSVRGGFSRLLTNFIRNYNFDNIISYVDRRWYAGDSYFKVGFNYVGTTKPNYWYVSGTKRYHRYNFFKSKLKKSENYDESLTEQEIMLKDGYYIIYDCGNLKYEYLAEV